MYGPCKIINVGPRKSHAEVVLKSSYSWLVLAISSLNSDETCEKILVVVGNSYPCETIVFIKDTKGTEKGQGNES